MGSILPLGDHQASARFTPILLGKGDPAMDLFANYLRDETARYRELAKATDDLSRNEELLSLATVCEETAANIEDCHPGG